MTSLVSATSLKVGRWTKALQLTAAVLIGLSAQGSLAQTTTLLNFDSMSDETPITNQFQAQGILVEGSVASNAAILGFTAKSGTQVAYSPMGLMTFNLSIADVKTVSAYVTGPADVGIFAYDATNALVGQALLPANAPANTLLSVTSSGLPITKVLIHDGGAAFAIDDLSFTTAAPPAPVPVCRAYGEDLYNAIAALPASAYVCARTASADRTRLLKEVADFEKLRASAAGQKKLLAQMQLIQKDVKKSTKAASNKSILQQIDKILALIKAKGC